MTSGCFHKVFGLKDVFFELTEIGLDHVVLEVDLEIDDKVSHVVTDLSQSLTRGRQKETRTTTLSWHSVIVTYTIAANNNQQKQERGLLPAHNLPSFFQLQLNTFEL